jgi:hypothetical protein
MTDDPVSLDGRRSAAGRIATDIRRHALQDFEADRQALRRRQEELEAQLLASPAEGWSEAAVKAQYLIRLYAATVEGQDARRAKRASARRSCSPHRPRHDAGLTPLIRTSVPLPPRELSPASASASVLVATQPVVTRGGLPNVSAPLTRAGARWHAEGRRRIKPGGAKIRRPSVG